MATKLETFLLDLPQKKALHRGNWVLPYAEAYRQAHKSFKGTLDEQAKYDKFIADASLMALTLVMGAGMSAIFAKAAVNSTKQLALNKTIDIVCDKNMKTTFDFMASVAGNPAASFLVGKAWDLAAAKGANAAKSKVTGLMQPSPLITDTIKDPEAAKSKLDRYNELTYAAVHEVAMAIQKSGMTDAEKDRAAGELVKTGYYKQAPYRTQVPTNAAELMELNMYMLLILANDKFEKSTGHGGAYHGSVKTKTTDIKSAPSSPSYPKPYNNNQTHGSGFGTSVSIDVGTVKVELGQKIVSRMNALSKKHLGETFTSRSASGWNPVMLGYQEVVKAEEMTVKIRKSLPKQN